MCCAYETAPHWRLRRRGWTPRFPALMRLDAASAPSHLPPPLRGSAPAAWRRPHALRARARASSPSAACRVAAAAPGFAGDGPSPVAATGSLGRTDGRPCPRASLRGRGAWPPSQLSAARAAWGPRSRTPYADWPPPAPPWWSAGCALDALAPRRGPPKATPPPRTSGRLQRCNCPTQARS